MNLAEDFYAADRERDRLETKIDDELFKCGILHDHWTADSYDGSIELYGVDNGELTAEQQAVLWRVGFISAWAHPGETKVKSAERYYAAPAQIVVTK